MFTKPVILVTLVLGGFSLCVDGINSDVISVDNSLAELRDRSEGPSECFDEFSVNQANTVKKLGQNWKICTETENKAKSKLNQELKKYVYEIAKVPNDICVGIDNDCRNKFAQDNDIEAVLLCFENWAIPARQQLMELSEDCKMKRITIDNENRLIQTEKKNCTNNANFEYLEESDYLFTNLITTCDNSPSEISTTTSTTQMFSKSTMKLTTPMIPDLTSTTEAEPAWETETTTRGGRFPWN